MLVTNHTNHHPRKENYILEQNIQLCDEYTIKWTGTEYNTI